MSSYYDTLVAQYEQYHNTPQSKYIDSYTYLNLLGNLENKSVLDLGCGYGFYTRMFRVKGANSVIGVDWSKEMIKLAQQVEDAKQLGIKYILADAMNLGKIGDFDLVVSSYVLNDLSNAEKLEKMAQTSYLNLKQGGRFLAITENVQMLPEDYHICQKYGYTKELIGELKDGGLIKVKYVLDNEQSVTFENYYLSRQVYEQAFQKSGFSQINWYSPQVSPEGIQKQGQEFWQDFINYQLMVGFEAIKLE